MGGGEKFTAPIGFGKSNHNDEPGMSENNEQLDPEPPPASSRKIYWLGKYDTKGIVNSRVTYTSTGRTKRNTCLRERFVFD